jgi:hypothetical protein
LYVGALLVEVGCSIRTKALVCLEFLLSGVQCAKVLSLTLTSTEWMKDFKAIKDGMVLDGMVALKIEEQEEDITSAGKVSVHFLSPEHNL